MMKLNNEKINLIIYFFLTILEIMVTDTVALRREWNNFLIFAFIEVYSTK